MHGLRRYGIWSGNPLGDPEDESRCIEPVSPALRPLFFHQCKRKRGKGLDGLYCGLHAKFHPAHERRQA